MMYVRPIETPAGTLLQYKLDSAVATVAEGQDEAGKWATIYYIQSGTPGKGHATKLLLALKKRYAGVRFGGTVALNPTMKHLYEKTGITEYE
jgi:hypothetical protein